MRRAMLLGVLAVTAMIGSGCAQPTRVDNGPMAAVEAQDGSPDLGIELPPMEPSLADESMGPEDAEVAARAGFVARPELSPVPLTRATPLRPTVPDPVITPVPTSGTRTFTGATGGSSVMGSGSKLVTYQIQVEGGIPGWTPELFASRVDPILADTRSWRAAGTWRFQRVPAGTTPSVYIRLATPKTVDYFCNQAGVNTQSKYSCRYGKYVMINLMRWTYAVPGFGTDLAGYRRMVINHETGHFLGYSHMSCPGTGRLAPVMQTQTIALNGCLPNSWPYPDGVHFVTGPPAAAARE